MIPLNGLSDKRHTLINAISSSENSLFSIFLKIISLFSFFLRKALSKKYPSNKIFIYVSLWIKIGVSAVKYLL